MKTKLILQTSNITINNKFYQLLNSENCLILDMKTFTNDDFLKINLKLKKIIIFLTCNKISLLKEILLRSKKRNIERYIVIEEKDFEKCSKNYKNWLLSQCDQTLKIK